LILKTPISKQVIFMIFVLIPLSCGLFHSFSNIEELAIQKDEFVIE